MALTEKERAKDLLEAADFCEELAKELVITSCHVENPVAILNAVDDSNTAFIDVLIQCDQKMVIAEFVVQQYLQEIWEGNLDWSPTRTLGFFFLMVLFPPVWFFFSMPIDFRMNKIPVIKFLCYLTGHIYFVLFLSLTAVIPPDPTVRDSLFPTWYEVVSLLWYSGNFLSLLTNPPAKGGLSWVKPLIVALGVIATIIHIAAIFVPSHYWSLLIYIRNIHLGATLLLCWIQVLDFLAFHPLFGPWAIIIGECLMDVGKFVVVLALFVMGYSMLASTMNQPFGYPSDYINDPELNPDNLSQKDLFRKMASEEDNNPIVMFEIHFFALFGITDYGEVMASKYLQGWTFYLFKVIFATYMTLTVIVLINLLIAMMSDTYCRIQEKSDIEWKFGLAKLIRNMQRTNVAPSPLNLFTTWLVLLRKRFLERKHEKMRAQIKFRRAMRDEIMQKAPGMRFVVEQRNKKKKKKPRVIHALGNIKWGFVPPVKTGVVNVDQLQTKWDRDHKMREQERTTFGSNTSLEEFRLLSQTIPWAVVIRSYMETQGRGPELKSQQGEETDKTVNDILKSITNVRNDRAKKEQAKKWSNIPSETKTKVINKWEEKAKKT